MKSAVSTVYYIVKCSILFCVIFTSCVQDDRMIGATCESSIQSKKDGVFLASCQIKPKRIIVGDKVLEIEEAFIEQQFLLRPSTGEIRLSSINPIRPKLVLIGSKDTYLGTGNVDWNMEIVNKNVIEDDEKFILANQPGRNIFVFDLKKVAVFTPQSFQIIVSIGNLYNHKNVKRFILKASPKIGKNN